MYRVLSAFFSCVILICTAQSSSDFTCGLMFGTLRPSFEENTEEIKKTLDSCMRQLATKEAGKLLLEKVKTLWIEYKKYEPNVLLGLEDGEPRFQGMDTKSPIIDKTSGSDGLEIDWGDDSVNWEEMQADEDPRMFFCRQKGMPVIENTPQIWYKDPSVVFCCPKGRKAQDIIGKQPAATTISNNKLEVDVKKSSVQLFLIVAHELIHMKHFLEERIFISQIVSGLIEKAEKDEALSEEISAFCGGLESLPDRETLRNIMIGEVKEPQKFQELCNLASTYKIGDFEVVAQLTDADSLKKLAYSCCKIGTEIDSTILEQFPEYAALADCKKEKLIELISDFEERRTVIGPDRDGITEAQIRFEFEEPIRFIYQDYELSLPIQSFKNVLNFDEESFEQIKRRLPFSSH